MMKIGCCGFPVSREKYFEEFSVVEIQQTFYQPPDVVLAEKWRRESPRDFEFTLKAWQLITHEPASPTYEKLKTKIPNTRKKYYGSFKPTDEVRAAWTRTREIAGALQARFVIFQCPASFGPTGENKKNMKDFFAHAERDGLFFGWEPRGRWPAKDIENLCRELDLIHVVDPFMSAQTCGELFYFRLHGRGGYRYRYTVEELTELKRLAGKKPDGRVMFNNVSMFDDAKRFQEMARQQR